MNNSLPIRKTIRLKEYDYSAPGAYFITICTKGKKQLLSQIVGTGVPDGLLSDVGTIPVGTGVPDGSLSDVATIPVGTGVPDGPLSDIGAIPVGTGVPDGPRNELTPYGKIANKHLINMSDFYDNIKIDKYVVMPNHIHLLIRILETDKPNGPSGTPVPTNSLVARFVSTFKRFCNKEYGENIWQSRSNDHIIRGKNDYQKIWEYIDTNVVRWQSDCFYNE